MGISNLKVVARPETVNRRANLLPFSRPAIGEDEIQEVVATLRSGWLTSGPRALKFEEEFARAAGARHAISLASGTAGFHLALLALGIGAGDEVVTSSLAAPNVANMIVLAGATPVFADVHPQTLNLEPTAVEQVLTPRTRAIVPSHFAGLACDLGALHALARSRGITVIEDAAHAAGATSGGRPIGGLSDLTVFSFHATANLATGEGGMLTTQSDRLAEQLRLLRCHGMDREGWKRWGPGGSPTCDVVQPGYEYTMTDLTAAIGLHQLRTLERHNASRTAHAAYYRRLLADVSELTLPVESSGHAARHAWHLFPVRVEVERLTIGRDEVMQRLREENVATGLHHRAVHTHPYYAQAFPHEPDALAWTERASERLISLPLFPQMAPADVEDVALALRRVLAIARRTK